MREEFSELMYHALKQPKAPPGEVDLSEVLAWSRMQAEAGQDLRAIIARKERERVAGEGLFCWGVGNAPARSIVGLAKLALPIDAVFSLMKSKPKAADVAPDTVLVWRTYFDVDGFERQLPAASLVTSRGNSATGRKRAHYALMCQSAEPLEFGDLGPFDPTAYRNVSESGGAIGPSQVTALLRRVSAGRRDTDYRINLRARLTAGYWVKLGDPVVLSTRRRAALALVYERIDTLSTSDWISVVEAAREGGSCALNENEEQARLF